MTPRHFETLSGITKHVGIVISTPLLIMTPPCPRPHAAAIVLYHKMEARRISAYLVLLL
jgi:hypothetical protein